MWRNKKVWVGPVGRCVADLAVPSFTPALSIFPPPPPARHLVWNSDDKVVSQSALTLTVVLCRGSPSVLWRFRFTAESQDFMSLVPWGCRCRLIIDTVKKGEKNWNFLVSPDNGTKHTPSHTFSFLVASPGSLSDSSAMRLYPTRAINYFRGFLYSFSSLN